MFFPDRPNEEIVFAWTPKRVEGGRVWWEYVRRTYQDYGFGGWTYTRLLR